MSAFLYVMEGLLVAAAIAFFVTYCTIKDLGFLLLAVLCGVSAGLSFLFVSWWPLLVGGVLSAILIFMGSGLGSSPTDR